MNTLRKGASLALIVFQVVHGFQHANTFAQRSIGNQIRPSADSTIANTHLFMAESEGADPTEVISARLKVVSINANEMINDE